MNDDKLRAEFEAWAEDNDCGITLAATSATGFYTRNIAWTAWQAAYAAGQEAEREAICIEWEGAEALSAEVERLRAELAAAKADLAMVEATVSENELLRVTNERLAADLAAAKAASVVPVEWKSAERFFKSGADLGNQWGIEFWFESKERRERFCKWMKERARGDAYLSDNF